MIKKMYKNVLPSQMFMLLMMNLASVIDSFFAGHYLNSQDLSAIGFYSPISNIIYLCYIFITGTQILVCQLIGKGDKDKASSLFTTSAVTITAYGILMGIVFVTMGNPLAAIVKADGVYADSLRLYLLGLSFGVPFMMLQCYFMSLLKLNDRNDLMIACIVGMLLVDTVMDFLFTAVLKMGIIGLAIASSITYIVVAFIGVWGFIRNKKRSLAICFDFGKIDFKIMPQVMRNGLTQLSFNLAMAINNLLINYILIFSASEEAIALMTVYNSLIAFIGVINTGVQDAELTIGSIYYGMKNKNGFEEVFRFGFILNSVLMLIVYIFIFIFAGAFSSIYFQQGSEMYNMSVTMIRLSTLSLFPPIISNITATSLQCQSKTGFPNVMQYVGTVIRLGCMALMAFLIGIDGVWLGMIINFLIIDVITFIYVFIRRGRVTFKFSDQLLLDRDFGVPSEKVFERRISSMEDAMKTAIMLEEFCKSNGVSKHDTYHISLCCEELIVNIFTHGDNGANSTNLYFVIDEDSHIVQIMDDCREFNPIEYLNQFQSEDPCKNIGLKLVTKVSKDVKYQRFLGVNSITFIQ